MLNYSVRELVPPFRITRSLDAARSMGALCCGATMSPSSSITNSARMKQGCMLLTGGAILVL